MAKSAKPKSQKATAVVEETPVPLAQQEVPKKMSKEEAQSILDQYSGINGTEIPAIVKKAREVLKEK